MDETLTELTEKQVVNVCDGRILGNIVDFRINTCDGKITAIVIPGEGGFFNFKKCVDVIIPWEKICKIADITISDYSQAPAILPSCEYSKLQNK